MYYCAFGYDGGLYPADHSKVDMDPSTREWYQNAVATGDIVYTDPYMDAVTGKMVPELLADKANATKVTVESKKNCKRPSKVLRELIRL